MKGIFIRKKSFVTILTLILSHTLFSQVGKLAFIQNKGQWPSDIKFKTDFIGGQALATTSGMLVGLFDSASLMQRQEWGLLTEDQYTGNQYFEEHPQTPDLKGHGWRYHFLNANLSIVIESKFESKDFYNFWIGDISQHASKVRSYEEITYKEVYQGVDVKYYTAPDGYLENDIIVKPFANTNNILFELEGIDELSLNASGGLVLTTTVGEVIVPAPISYLIDSKGNKTPILVSFILENNLVRFSIPVYDNSKTLVIDPIVLRWASWATNNTSAASGANAHNHGAGIDSLGNLYIAGKFDNTGLITVGAFKATTGGGQDIFAGKYTEPTTPGGTGSRIWQTYIGGTQTENCNAVEMGTDGYMFLACKTTSDFPKTMGTGFTAGSWTQRTASSGTIAQALILKLDLQGNGALAREIGSISKDYGFEANDVRSLKTGVTKSSYHLILAGQSTHPKNVGVADGDFPAPKTPAGTTYTTPNTTKEENAIVMRITNNFDSIYWVRDIGSDSVTAKDDYINIVKVDNAGNIYAGGATNATQCISYKNPSTQTTLVGTLDGWLMKMNSSGVVQWSRYYNSKTASNDTTNILCMELNSTDTAIIIGGITTGLAAANITSGVVQATYGGGLYDLFLAKIPTRGNTTTWGTYYGGSDEETNLMGLNLDVNDDIYFLGYTRSTNYATASNPIQAVNYGSVDAVITKLNSTGTTTMYGTYFGGSSGDNDPIGQRGIIVSGCRIYLAISSQSNDNPFTSSTLTPTRVSVSIIEPIVVSMANPPDLNGNKINSNQTISCGQTPSTLTAGVPTYNIADISRNAIAQTSGTAGAYPSGKPTPSGYQWQKSIDYRLTWTNIAGAVSQNYSPPATFQTTYYRRVVSGDYCVPNDSVAVINVTGGPSVAPTATCAASTVSFFANPTGGSGSNTFVWSGPLSFSSTLQNPQILSATSAVNGYYTVTVTDAGGCKNTKSFYFDFGSCSYSVVLSVSLLTFDAVKVGSKSKLLWQTANEHNSESFIVQRSANGIDWTEIGILEAAGNSSVTKGYQFIDVAPLVGKNIYRLKVTELGGKFQYSSAKSLTFEGLNTARINQVTPNPFQNSLMVNYNIIDNANVSIEILDAQGRILSITNEVAQKGENTVTINTSELTKGIYFITVKCNEVNTGYKKLIKE